MECFTRRRGVNEAYIEMEDGEREDGGNVGPFPKPESEIEIEIEDWVGVHSLKNMPKSFKPQELSTTDFSSLIQSLRAQEAAKDCSSAKNRMARLFCSLDPGAAETQVLKAFFKKMKKDQSKSNPISQYNIILLDAKNPNTLKQSFKKVVEILDRKNDTRKLSTEEIMEKIYRKMSSETSPKDQSLFIFVGAESWSEITQFLPKEDVVLPFCQFLVTTSSKTFNWESKSELKEWSNKNFLIFDKELIEFDWEGVHSASKLPPSFQPIPDFAGQAEIINNLVQRFQDLPLQNFQSDSLEQVQMERKISLSPPRASLTVISGVKGIGKTELVTKFLSKHPQLFAKVVLINAEHPMDSLKVFAYNSGLGSESATEGNSLPDRITFLHSKITKDFQGNQRVLFVFDNADSLHQIKRYLPKPNNFKRDDIICDVIVTSRSRDWGKEEDLKFYRDNDYGYHEIPLFDGLSLDETHEFCSKILPQNGICYVREDLERSIRELHKVTGGFPPLLQHLKKFISKSSRSNPELTPKQHILNYLRRDFQQFRLEMKPFDWNPHFKVSVEPESKSSVSKPSQGALRLLQVLCLMNPEHLDFHMICYFYLEHEDSFKPPPKTSYEPGQVKHVEELLRNLETDSLIQVDRAQDGKLDKIRLPAFLREFLSAEKTETSDSLRNFLYGSELPHSSWTRPLDVPQLWPHILSLNESYTRFHGYHNQVLIECIKHHLEFWKNPPKDGEEGQRPDTDYETEKEKIKELLEKTEPDFKSAFGDFTQMENPGYLLPLLFLILFVTDVVTDLSNSITLINPTNQWGFGLTLSLIIFPFVILCLLHYFDRKEYHRKMKNRRRMSWWEVLRMFAGTFDSYFLRLWYIWRFRRETGNLERGLLYERLCIMRANAEYHGIAEAFVESLPQLLFQFTFYVIAYTVEVEDLRKLIQRPYIPFELGLLVSLFSFSLALTKLESVYFGWNMELFGIKRLGHHILHLLINLTHIATLMFCTGIVVVPFIVLIVGLGPFFCLSATAWIIFNDKYFVSRKRMNKSFKSSLKTGVHSLLTFFASFHPGFLDKGRKLESSSKHAFVTAKLGHDILLLQRRPRKSDIIYLLFFLTSLVYFTIFCSILGIPARGPGSTASPIRASRSIHFSRIHYISQKFIPSEAPLFHYSVCYWIPWLSILFKWQMLRQFLNFVYLRYFKAPPLTEDYILNDPEGIFRYPVDSPRWIQLRLYHQIRQNQPTAFSQTWTQVKQNNFYQTKNSNKVVVEVGLFFTSYFCYCSVVHRRI